MILLEDEKLVLKWVSQYGPLTRDQLLGLLSYKPRHIAEKILVNLRKAGRLRSFENGYCMLDKFSVPDPKKVPAVWVLLKFIDHVNPENHRPADYPAEIFFMKDSQAYEIVVVPDGEEYITQLLQNNSGQRYIFVISDISMAAGIRCPDVPCLFAVYRGDDLQNPVITFYSREDLEGGK